MRLPGNYTGSLPRLLLASLILTMGVGVLLAGATSNASFGAYNPDWNGGQAYRSLADHHAATTIATNTTTYDTVSPPNTTAIVLSPRATYSNTDLDRVRSFVRDGGTLVVAADFETGGNELLRGLGVQTRFDGRPVRDEEHYYRAPSLPIATNVTQTPLTGNASRLTLNEPTALTHTQHARVLAETSGYAYIDTNRNSELDDNETLAARPVVAVESLGKGRVVAVSDPSIFINRMLDRPGNHAFATALITGNHTVLFDYSHTHTLPPLQAASLYLHAHMLLAYALFAGILLLIAAWTHEWTVPITTLTSRLRRPETTQPQLSREEITRLLSESHPDWAADRIERVADRVAQARGDE